MRWLRAFFLPVSVTVLVAAALTVPLPMFTERPGQLLSLDDEVTVEAEDVSPVDGDFLLTAVTLRRATVVTTARALLDEEIVLVPDSSFIPSGIDDATYFERQRAVFATTADVAAALGLRAAGFPADPRSLTGDGVLVVETLPGSPAEGTLESGDVIVSVGGDEVRTAEDLVGAVSAGEDLSVRFTRNGDERTAALTPQFRDVEGETRPVIGVTIETLRPRIELPVDVDVDAGRLGGPSAGLMIALTVFDKASPSVDVAAGRKIAGTGAIDEAGNVRPIGGIRQKVRAASRGGADLFLAPAAQVGEASGAAPPGGMEVVGVDSLDEAIRVLTERDSVRGLDRSVGWASRRLAA